MRYFRRQTLFLKLQVEKLRTNEERLLSQIKEGERLLSQAAQVKELQKERDALKEQVERMKEERAIREKIQDLKKLRRRQKG